MSAQVKTIIVTGVRGLIVDVECHLSNSLPNIVIVGFANKAVDEAKERIRGAFASSHIMLPRKRTTVNLAPADIPKDDSGFDLAIAVAILHASQLINAKSAAGIFIGELGLDGSTRGVRGIIGKILAGRAEGFKHFYIPHANLKQAQLVPNIKLTPVKSLEQLYIHLTGLKKIKNVNTDNGLYVRSGTEAITTGVQLSEIAGQEQAKRTLIIAAAGGHNLFFSGPPGTGKSMLAKALASVLPPLGREEMLEATHLHSLSSHNYEQIVINRPFRSPHHSASHVAITGGGTQIRPGEISLAHRGVLFFDEIPEFSRATLEALRQPLEDRIINISRAKDSIEYPADFILVATANPCPCGFYGSGEACRCSARQVMRYQQKISGPILDRIDLHASVHEVKHARLLKQKVDANADEQVRQNIASARTVQIKRLGSSKLNASMSNRDIKQFCKLTTEASELLNLAARRLNISARGYMRTIKVARTIADLENAKNISKAHVSEALAYRAPLHS